MYASPMIVELGGIRQVVSMGQQNIEGVAVADGVTPAAYIGADVNLVSLPIQQVITDMNNSTIAQTRWCYDNGQGVAGACSSSSLLDDANIAGHDSSFGTGYTTRGNVTTASRWLNTTNTYLPSAITYDVAGNVHTATDRNGNTTTYTYTDQFTTGTTLPGGQATYGFVTNVALPSSTGFSYSQKYDYYLGKPTQLLLYGWRQGAERHWCGARDQGDVWSFDKPRLNDLHPTMKPVELIERAITNSSRSGDT